MLDIDRYRTAELLFDQRKYAEAAKELQALLDDARSGDDALTHGFGDAELLLARSYFHSAQLVKAEATARLLVEADPTDAYALVLLGRSLQRQSKREEADKFLRQAQIWGTDGIPELTPTEDETDNDSSTDTDTSKEKS